LQAAIAMRAPVAIAGAHRSGAPAIVDIAALLQ
jgi:hypothetical protein